MTWIALAGPVSYATALLLLPGLLISLAGGRRGFSALALAPAFSVTAMSVGGVLGGLLGVPWGWWSPAVTAVLMAGAAWLAWRLNRSRDRTQPLRERLNREWPLWFGFALGAVIWLRCLRLAYPAPDSFSQLFDNVFHLNLIRFMAQEANGSSLTAGTIDPITASAFYPAAFHDFASLVLIAFPDNIALATNAAIWTMLAIAWPLGCLLLAWALNRRGTLTLVGVGVLSASFPGFPFLLLHWGVLYPNILALILLPTTLALALEALGMGRSQHPNQHALMEGGLTAPGLALSHPSALLSFVVFMSAPLAVRLWDQIRVLRTPSANRRDWISAISLTICVISFVLAWRVLRPWEAPWEPPLSRFEAAGQAIFNAPFGPGPAWAVSVLVLIGLITAWRQQQGWLVWSWLAAATLWLAAASGPEGDWRDMLTGGFYNDPYRVGALLAVVAIPVAAVGLSASTSWLTERASRLFRTTPAHTGTAVALLAALALTLTTQPSQYLTQTLTRISDSLALTEGSWMLTVDELTLIKRIPSHVEPGAVIAINPWNGSSMAYAFTGVPTTIKHVFYTPTLDLDIVQSSLDEAASDPAVCPALRDLNVRYVLDFGEQELTPQSRHPFPGFDSLPSAPGFEQVDREGDVALYRITACP